MRDISDPARIGQAILSRPKSESATQAADRILSKPMPNYNERTRDWHKRVNGSKPQGE